MVRHLSIQPIVQAALHQCLLKMEPVFVQTAIILILCIRVKFATHFVALALVVPQTTVSRVKVLTEY
jgi:hypothetical protein